MKLTLCGRNKNRVAPMTKNVDYLALQVLEQSGHWKHGIIVLTTIQIPSIIRHVVD